MCLDPFITDKIILPYKSEKKKIHKMSLIIIYFSKIKLNEFTNLGA